MTSELDELVRIGSSPPSLDAVAAAWSGLSAPRDRYDAALLFRSKQQDGGSATERKEAPPLVAAAKAELQRADAVLHGEKNRLEAVGALAGALPRGGGWMAAAGSDWGSDWAQRTSSAAPTGSSWRTAGSTSTQT